MLNGVSQGFEFHYWNFFSLRQASQWHTLNRILSIVHIFQEPYRADLLQKVYYTLDSSKQIFNVLNNIPELYSALKEARQLGEFQPLFPVEHNKYTNIGHCIPLQEIAEYVV